MKSFFKRNVEKEGRVLLEVDVKCNCVIHADQVIIIYSSTLTLQNQKDLFSFLLLLLKFKPILGKSWSSTCKARRIHFSEGCLEHKVYLLGSNFRLDLTDSQSSLNIQELMLTHPPLLTSMFVLVLVVFVFQLAGTFCKCLSPKNFKFIIYSCMCKHLCVLLQNFGFFFVSFPVILLQFCYKTFFDVFISCFDHFYGRWPKKERIFADIYFPGDGWDGIWMFQDIISDDVSR